MGERYIQKDRARESEQEGGVFTHGCVTPPVSGDLQERSCCSLSLLLWLSFIRVLFPLSPCFTVSDMNCCSLYRHVVDWWSIRWWIVWFGQKHKSFNVKHMMLCKSVKTAKTLWDTVITMLDIEHSTLLYVLMAFWLRAMWKGLP